jgi:hypothetical protein
MKKIICKNNTFSPNFKKDKIYHYEYNNGIYSIIDDFSILFKFDKKHQTSFQDVFNFKPKNALFDDFFYELKEFRKLKLEKLLKIT